MNNSVVKTALGLAAEFGREAMDECRRRQEYAIAARDHSAGIHWADVGARLSVMRSGR